MEEFSVAENEIVKSSTESAHDNFISNGPKIIGFKNFTNHAGATSLIYMLKNQLANNYRTVAIEVNKRDFMFFNDKDMVSCRSVEFNNMLLKYKDANVILVDLNDLEVNFSNLCSDIIYSICLCVFFRATTCKQS